MHEEEHRYMDRRTATIKQLVHAQTRRVLSNTTRAGMARKMGEKSSTDYTKKAFYGHDEVVN